MKLVRRHRAGQVPQPDPAAARLDRPVPLRRQGEGQAPDPDRARRRGGHTGRPRPTCGAGDAEAQALRRRPHACHDPPRSGTSSTGAPRSWTRTAPCPGADRPRRLAPSPVPPPRDPGHGPDRRPGAFVRPVRRFQCGTGVVSPSRGTNRDRCTRRVLVDVSRAARDSCSARTRRAAARPGTGSTADRRRGAVRPRSAEPLAFLESMDREADVRFETGSPRTGTCRRRRSSGARSSLVDDADEARVAALVRAVRAAAPSAARKSMSQRR